MAKKSAREARVVRVASRDEIDQAIEALTHGQLIKLEKYAAWRIRGLGRASSQRDGEDLLQEALTSTIAGSEGSEGRHWNTAVDFAKHLSEAMRSISDHWKTQFAEDEPFLESEVKITTPNGEEFSPLAVVPSQEPGVERALLAKEQVRQIAERFRDDDEATLVLQGWDEGMSGPEIIDLGLSKERYGASIKRIRYAVGRRTVRGE
jgi:hypothetical protein